MIKIRCSLLLKKKQFVLVCWVIFHDCHLFKKNNYYMECDILFILYNYTYTLISTTTFCLSELFIQYHTLTIRAYIYFVQLGWRYK